MGNNGGINLVHLVMMLDAGYILLGTISFFTGTFLFIYSLSLAKRLGNSGFNTHSAGISPTKFWLSLLVGLFLIYFPSTLINLNTTIFGDTIQNPFSYRSIEDFGNTGGNQAQLMVNALSMLFKLFGAWAVFHGWMLVKQIGDGRNEKATPMKATFFIIFGVMNYRWQETLATLAWFFPFLDSLKNTAQILLNQST